MLKNWKAVLISFIKGWGYSILIAVIIATSFRSAIADWNDVPTGSMKPTIIEGDRIFINKLAYDLKIPYTTRRLVYWNHPDRGDIVVFYSPENGKRLVKRVIGIPGDTITMVQNRLYINNEMAEYEKIDMSKGFHMTPGSLLDHRFFHEKLKGTKHRVMFTPANPSLHSFGPIVIPDGHYFMMGDNRDNSADSRFFGFVARKLIVGRATTVVVSRDGSFFHLRWDRFLKKL